ncbi:MAG: hypothetical protein EB084_19890 [Proteobacteria bacterium]|nr:hypothetical protein [Pseudomonadota bacterium]
MKRMVVMGFSNSTVCYPSRTVGAPTGGDGARTSVVDGLRRFLHEHGVEIDQYEESEGEGCFTVVLVARQTSPEPSLALLRERLRAYGQSVGLTIRVQREDLFLAMHRI